MLTFVKLIKAISLCTQAQHSQNEKCELEILSRQNIDAIYIYIVPYTQLKRNNVYSLETNFSIFIINAYTLLHTTLQHLQIHRLYVLIRHLLKH